MKEQEMTEQDRVEPAVERESRAEVEMGVQAEVAPGRESDGPEAQGTVTPQDNRTQEVLAVYRGRFRELDDETWEATVQRIQSGQSMRSIALDLIEQGLCPNLSPSTVGVYLGRVRDALGVPALPGVDEEAKERGEEDEPVEGADALKRLRWLARIQQARVRKALRMEAQMGELVLPQASSEIKLMSELLDKELKVALETGEIQPAPKKVEVEEHISVIGSLVPDPQSALRVLVAVRRLLQQGTRILPAETVDVAAEDGQQSE
jgi:hypothetical protein